MRCNKCNSEVSGKFCSNCGTKLPKNNKIGKLLGFRSNKLWKKIVSIVYLCFCLILFLYTITSARQGKITTYDFLVDKIFQFVLCISFLSPYVFLSNTKFRNKLPLFKKHTVGASIGGLSIVLFLLLISIGIINSLHSAEYQADMANHADVLISEIEATCTKNGEISYICEYCGRQKTDVISAKGHDFVEISRSDATCTTKGTIVSKCSVCDEETKREINELGHEMVEVSREEPTTENEGKIISKCQLCDYSVTEKIDKVKPNTNSDNSKEENKGTTTSTTNDKSSSQNTNTAFDKVISDKTLIKNICEALNSICIDQGEISSVKKVDDWVAGERYNFNYKGLGLTIYTNMNSTIYSITLGVDTHIYLQGYEPYNINNYIIDSYTQSSLKTNAMNKVKSQLNFPSTADFPWLDWSYGRDHNLYSVSSSVKAKNAFGVEDEIAFTLIYHIKDNTSKLVYFMIDGSVVVNSLDNYSKPERKEIPSESTEQNENASNEITLVYGQLGKYGKEVTLDGEKYVNFHVPQGTYTVKSNVKWCVMYVAKDEYFKNSDGWMENEIVETVILDSNDKTATITVKDGEHIELSLHGSITLIPQQ